MRVRFLLSPLSPPRKGPFKFANVMTSMPGFLPLVKDFWEGTPSLFPSTSALFRFSKKLKSLKPQLRNLSRRKLHDLSRRTELAFEVLCDKQSSTLADPSSRRIAEESTAYDRWDKVALLEENYLKQRSKLHWLKVGDKNNKFFHNAVKARLSRNSIKEIRTQEGTILTSNAEIQQEAVRFFSDFLSHKPEDYTGISVEELRSYSSFRCSEQERESLTSEISDEVIKATLFSLPNNKSPGPDGYTAEFFKSSWPILGKDLVAAVRSFFQFGFLPKGINTTILALIPKKEGAQDMKDYRPISCCNVLYKTISKILANRLQAILPGYIAPNQSAFIKNRLLMENLLLASELVKDYHKAGISSRCAIKIDISKAFDSVQWPFLLNALAAANLPDKFIHWIKLCVTSASFSVQVNGELAGFFRSKRGLRQGCSLSPYLFVICLNVLSQMLDKAATAGILGFHPKCKSLKLTHLSFADDLMVFTDGTSRSLAGTLEIFQRFAAISGLKISPEKSTIYISGVSTVARDHIVARFGLPMGTLPVRYLGLPLLTKRMTTADYLPLIEKIRTRISSWKNRFLSYGGRLQLLLSVIASLTNFWISAFRLPSACIKEIERICSAFLWSGSDLNPRKSKVSWQDICRPKSEGGLGIKSLAEMNKVSCLKLIWRIVSDHQSLWVKWIKQSLIRT